MYYILYIQYLFINNICQFIEFSFPFDVVCMKMTKRNFCLSIADLFKQKNSTSKRLYLDNINPYNSCNHKSRASKQCKFLLLAV